MKTDIPGDFVGTEEEFLSVRGCYSDDNNYYSMYLGIEEIDEKKRQAQVKSVKQNVRIGRGSIVYGTVETVTDKMAQVSLFHPDTDHKVIYFPNYRGILRIADADQKFVENMRDLFVTGDIIKAKVERVEPDAMIITTKYPEYGVIKAFCSKCRQPLYKSKGKLMCLKCGNLEDRKISTEYLLGA